MQERQKEAQEEQRWFNHDPNNAPKDTHMMSDLVADTEVGSPHHVQAFDMAALLEDIDNVTEQLLVNGKSNQSCHLSAGSSSYSAGSPDAE